MARFQFYSDWSNTAREVEMLFGSNAEIIERTKNTFVFQVKEPWLTERNVKVTGRDFKYIDGEAVSGIITGIEFETNYNGRSSVTELSITEIDKSEVASDLALFYSNVFGSRVEGGIATEVDILAAWGHLLAGDDTFVWAGGFYHWQSFLLGVNAGNDRFIMGNFPDFMDGGIGNDFYDGGAGEDEITFRETNGVVGQTAIHGIRVDIQAGRIIDAWGDIDTFVNVERFEGSWFNDTFIGDSSRNEFAGLRGRDVFVGRGGSDQLNYLGDYLEGGRFGIVVDLETTVDARGRIKGTIRDGFGNLDTTYDIENIIGTPYDDKFIGSSKDNTFVGGKGKDRYIGGAGFDTASFSSSFEGHDNTHIDLTRRTNQVVDDGWGNTETLTSIEAIIGGGRPTGL